ncbi:hypothetical protein L1077_26270 [Pseudoalteromonas luteoviolacea]|uniref:hypothetical protein n=1 Tax=Pseudoalteromonas luteoviolacea TaxID=43657 RepID=UPI001F26763A|nr:hypothetical protein [Pseudoalteromonas luteoviolacea]MCF6442933.1 hypothetical protein [Pseudoalteromonas luteoviolacea]
MKIRLKKQKIKNLSADKNEIPANVTPNVGAGEAPKSNNGHCETDWFCLSENFCQSAQFCP